jgi:hypothetical protein
VWWRDWSVAKRVTVAVSAVVTIGLVGTCIGVYGRADGPTYAGVAEGFCEKLAYDVFVPALGPLEDSLERAGAEAPDRGVKCRVQYDSKPRITLTVTVSFFGSEADAGRAFSAFMAASRSNDDMWDLDVPVKAAQWGYNRIAALAMMQDGNMASSVIITGTPYNDMDVHFGEPMLEFVKSMLKGLEEDSPHAMAFRR